MHVWKYHNEIPLYNEYTLIKKKKYRYYSLYSVVFSLVIYLGGSNWGLNLGPYAC
jgi:hypothetical protein